MSTAVPGSRAISEVRRAVRTLLDEVSLHSGQLAVAVSGGADSLALAAATAQLADRPAHRRRLTLHGLIVDHRLQPGSADVAERAAKQLHGLGFAHVRVLEVDVRGPGGPEAAARRARYAALRGARPAEDSLVLLGHTRDDQAETVLLGLGRGSGPRSIAGMRRLDPPWARPLLDVPRSVTAEACADLGLDVWQDPHNADPGFARVRLRREVLPLLEDVLRGGVAAALARTATQLREDSDALDVIAERVLVRARRCPEGRLPDAGCPEGVLPGTELEVGELAAEPPALRRRVLRRWLLEAGVAELTDGHLRSADALIGEWRGQGGVWLPGGLEVSRVRGRLTVSGRVSG
ncbi:tRNA lysidine(34) synthetase TilS [Actinophytocola sp.]|uniref:tRNA lysidine(34) synthetase TilS n=1 Tax=Actinophytocola sp. TaxID=1872138 RepID=UPI003D6BDE38